MRETIDLIEARALRELKKFTRETGQPTERERLDTVPMEHVEEIEITEEHVTITYNVKTERNYNTNVITKREWIYKYNDDPEFVTAIARVIEIARKHHRDLPDNVACPPGCAECCGGYEPFVNGGDVQRIADHLALTYDEVMHEYVNPRRSADGYVVGWLKKVGDDIGDKCVFLKGPRSGRYYCGIYEGRPDDCGAFTPIGCDDVDRSLEHGGHYVVGDPFRPKRRR